VISWVQTADRSNSVPCAGSPANASSLELEMLITLDAPVSPPANQTSVYQPSKHESVRFDTIVKVNRVSTCEDETDC